MVVAHHASPPPLQQPEFHGFGIECGRVERFAFAQAELPLEYLLHGRSSALSPTGRAASISMRDVSM